MKLALRTLVLLSFSVLIVTACTPVSGESYGEQMAADTYQKQKKMNKTDPAKANKKDAGKRVKQAERQTVKYHEQKNSKQ